MLTTMAMIAENPEKKRNSPYHQMVKWGAKWDGYF